MQASHYKNRWVVPTVHKKSPRDYYASFCILNSHSGKSKCFTVRPNFKTKGQAMEAAYNAGRAKVDAMLVENKWSVLIKIFKQLARPKHGEKRKAETVYLS